MSINLKKYESQLRAAVDDVLSDSDTDWYEMLTRYLVWVYDLSFTHEMARKIRVGLCHVYHVRVTK